MNVSGIEPTEEQTLRAWLAPRIEAARNGEAVTESVAQIMAEMKSHAAPGSAHRQNHPERDVFCLK